MIPPLSHFTRLTRAGFVFARVAEETCKMLGTVMLLSATLSELREGGEVRVRVE